MNTATIASLQAKLWYNDLFADVPKMLFMDRFMGESSNNPVMVCKDLTAKPGNAIEFGLSTKLSGNGTDGDDELEGNEEAIQTYQTELLVDQKRHAVRLKGRMDEKKVAYKMRTDAKEKLKIWWAEKIDQELLDKACGKTSSTFANTPTAPSANRAVWAGGVAADNSLTATMTFDTKCIDSAKELATTCSPKVRPIRLEDKAYQGLAVYVILVHPYQATALRQDPVWVAAQKDANTRGAENPILSGALGIYNGCLVYEHEGIYKFNNGSAVSIARAVLMGQQAVVYGEGAPERWVEKEFDYGNKWGISAGRIFGVIKPVFNSEDYGLITITTAAARASTA